MNIYGFQCKTQGCPIFLTTGELPEDTAHATHHPINLGADPLELTCPDCHQAHDYYTSEVVVRKPVHD